MNIDWTVVITSLIAVGVPVVGRLIEKWLDRRSKSQPKRKQLEGMDSSE